MPRKLKKDNKKQLVETISDMEASFPKDAKPVDDPALSGQWTLVYSSSSRVRMDCYVKKYLACFGVGGECTRKRGRA